MHNYSYEPLTRIRFSLSHVVSAAILAAASCLFFFSPEVHALSVPTTLTISICGDAIVNAGEQCDLGVGFNVGTYGSSTAERVCASDCVSFGPYCGDAVLQVRFSEQCDDGNNTSGDLCTNACMTETPTPGGGAGSPAVGSIPSGAGVPGILPADPQTKVVLRGKAYPGAMVNVLVDGKAVGQVKADANADFIYSTVDITPGTATFGFWANDAAGVASITTSMVFEVAQSAVTTVANIFFPPTVSVSAKQVPVGDLLTVSGQSVPMSKITSEINPGEKATLLSDANSGGDWALQVDTRSLGEGFHTIKSFFELSDSTRSGFGKSVSFYVGEGSPLETGKSDLNGDDKVNLIDFSIFLISWGSDDPRSDFNQDGSVNLADFSIMLFNWTG